MIAITPAIRRIGLRQFNRVMYKEIKDLPIIVTKDREPYLLVMPYSETLESTTSPTVLQSMTPVPPLRSYFSLPKEQPLTRWQKIKNILNTKLF